MEAAGNGLSTEMSDLRNYVMAQCLWSADGESWELMKEFCTLNYGPASQAILDYFYYLHDNARGRDCIPIASRNLLK